LLHRGYVYDLGLRIFGFPFALYVSERLQPLVSVAPGQTRSVLVAAVYIYIVLVVLNIYTALFGYGEHHLYPQR
jgi:hypothetical protein